MLSDKHLKIYKASAGAGKTHTITEQYIRMLYSYGMRPVAHQHILAVTFTNKATAEMKDRILLTLNNIMSDVPDVTTQDLIGRLGKEYGLTHDEVCARAAKYFTEILFSFPEFMVSTIDSFFVRVVRSCAYELGITDDYDIQIESKDIVDQAVNGVFASLSDHDNRPMLEWFKSHSIERLENGEAWNIRSALKDVEKLLGSEEYKKISHKSNAVSIDDVSRYIKELRALHHDFLSGVRSRAGRADECIRANGLTAKSFSGGSKSGFGVLEKLAHGEKKAITDGLSKKFLNAIEDHSAAASKTSEYRSRIIELMDSELGDLLNDLRDFMEQGTAPFLTAALILKNTTMLALLAHIEKQYRQLANAGRKMMLGNTGELIRRMIDGTSIPFIYEKLGTSLQHFMIDEFQDTSDLQWENFRPLIVESLSKSNDNMLVGDVKQSIFRWRNSNWHLMADDIPNDPALAGHIDTLNSHTNWRSRRAIVEFNNRLFLHLNASRDELDGNYNDAKQSVCPKFAGAETGCVVLNFNIIEKGKNKTQGDAEDEAAGDDSQVANWLEEHIGQCLSRGFSHKDICILVNQNDDGAAVARALSERGIPVTSSKALLLSHSPAVMFTTLLIRHSLNADDAVKFNLLSLYARYALKHNEQDALAYAGKNKNTDIDDILGIDTKSLVKSAVDELVKTIFHSLRLDGWDAETLPHLLEYIDTVDDVAPQVSYNTEKFLKWWDRNNKDLYVQMPDNDAVKILTIHKAKGLAAPVIMIPKCSKTYCKFSSSDITWVPTARLDPPFNALPIVPVNIESCGKTLFEDALEHEKRERVTDALNTLYVALTRPIHELYVNVTLKKDSDLTQSTGGALLNFARSWADHEQALIANGQINDTMEALGIGSKVINDTDNSLTVMFGTPIARYSASAKNDEEYASVNITQMRVDHDLIMRNTGKLDNGTYSGLNFQPHILGVPLTEDDDDTVTDISQLPTDENKKPWLSFGLLMHELLSGMTSSQEVDERVNIMVDNGHITRQEAPLLLRAAADMLGIKGVRQLLDTEGVVLNEHTVIDAHGQSLRPDRVVLTNDKKAIIVDYKFGTELSERHKKQVSRYAELFRQMGYEPEGYLIYGTLKKLLKVC